MKIRLKAYETVIVKVKDASGITAQLDTKSLYSIS